ncbi:hypothetical protein [Streptomyces sp. NPDC000351]|uniref:hypothetical protein n=1 Tax=Streptomyces sp. NPDC000351 TaxID=3154250 RepID=UPI00332CC240
MLKPYPKEFREDVGIGGGDTVKIGAWLATACTEHRTGRLPRDRARLVVALVDGDWTPEAAAYAVLAWTPAFSGAWPGLVCCTSPRTVR